MSGIFYYLEIMGYYTLQYFHSVYISIIVACLAAKLSPVCARQQILGLGRDQEFVTTYTATSQAGLSPDKTVRCHCVLVPVSSPLELKIDQLRENAVIKPSPPL